MAVDTFQALQAAGRNVRPLARGASPTTLLLAGATGALGNELLNRMAGAQRHARTLVLAKEPMTDGLRGVESLQVPALPIAQWPVCAADVALVSFDPPRLYHDRERVLWTPAPGDLPELARWLKACGVKTIAIVQPHAQGRMPEALKRGLAGLDEHAVIALDFECVLLVRSAQKPSSGNVGNPGERLAAWMLSVFRYMVPSSEQPVRASKVAEFVECALQLAPPGVHIAAPELVWQAAQGGLEDVVNLWLRGSQHG